MDIGFNFIYFLLEYGIGWKYIYIIVGEVFKNVEKVFNNNEY